MIWVLFGVMLLAAALVVTRPIYRTQQRLTPTAVVAAVIVLSVSTLVYSRIGTPVPGDSLQGVEEMVAALDQRLQKDPDDVEGWKMLGRSYVQLENYPKAIAALERAVELQSPADAQTLAELGEALLIVEGADRSARTSQVFEAALAVNPNNPMALFYGGVIASERGDNALAADRWEALLGLSPPVEIQDVLHARIAEWRGEEKPAQQAEVATDRAVAVNVTLGSGAAADVASDATVFIIARDPAQPSPPIAAARRIVSELPAEVSLSDADAMIPGRLLSAFDRVEIVARVSRSGDPMAQPGDWYGQNTISNPPGGPIEIVIEKQVQ
jgi:cytochrome c-type biogenesis protein CcmH